MLTKGDEEESDEEDESTPMVGSPKQVKLGAGTKEIVDVGPNELVDPMMTL